MDKSWINLPRVNPIYLQGVLNFMEFACKDILVGQTEIACPCKKCHNMARVKIDLVKEHLVVHGFTPSYTDWIFHGERSEPTSCGVEVNGHENLNGQDEMQEMVRDAFGIPPIQSHDVDNDFVIDPPFGNGNIDEETTKFFKLLKDSERELYPGCQKFSLLSFIVSLMHIKCLCGWSNKSFTMLLKLLKKAFPDGEILPNSYSSTKTLLGGLGLEYYKVHACPRDCMLYWGEDANRVNCKVCEVPRYKPNDPKEKRDGSKKRGEIPQKIVRYFPLIPRLKRLYSSTKTAGLMRWHAENPAPTGFSRHPVDSGVWKLYDNLYPDFAEDPRNVRLGLASDGFNPYGALDSNYSIWPVVMMTYNLPPWLCMKQPYMMLTLLIDGPKSPGNDIDVYLRLIVDELKELWYEGVNTYDAFANEMFNMRALLMWTINDFPAYAMLSGYSTKGYLACPCCHSNTCSRRLVHGKKICYLGHRKWLDENHKFRYQRMSFDGTTEFGACPTRLSGSEVLAMFPVNYVNEFGNEGDEELPFTKKRKTRGGEDEEDLPGNWKKKSIFFDLPTWKHNPLRHNLDVMHIQKNICESLVGTIMDLDGKRKDNLNARRDLQLMEIRKALHPMDQGGGKVFLPHACFAMNNVEKTMFCNLLKQVKVPDGYASNISRCVKVKKRTISGLKSHDYHVLMDQFLPIAVSRTLPKKVSGAVIELCNFFRQLCLKVVKVDDLDNLQSRIALTLCQLEKIFPPSFFDIMEHLPIHLVEEIKMGGPVRLRWMYYIERYLRTLKQYVRNNARPEGSISEGYWAEECMTFCSRYLDDVETKLNRPVRNSDGGDAGQVGGRPLGKKEKFYLNLLQKTQAHRYILFNTETITPYREKHLEFLKQRNRRIRDRELERLHHETFHIWLQNYVHKLQLQWSEDVSDEVANLALGPRDTAVRFSGYIINGVKYHTKARELGRKTQNSGVMLSAKTSSYSSARDMNPQEGDVTYYGRITDMLELYYAHDHKYVLFNCDWIDNNRGLVANDEFGFTLVNFNFLLYATEHVSNEPFILASQAQQVFYVQDPARDDWSIVIKVKPRDLVEICEAGDGHVADIEVDGINQQEEDETARLHDEDNMWVRDDLPGLTLDVDTL